MGFLAAPDRGPLQGEPPPEVPRDRWQRPLIRPVDGGEKLVPYTRASTLGSALEDAFGLMAWKVRCALKGASERDDVLLALQSLTLEDKAKLDELAELAHEAAGGNEAARVGTAIHAIADRIDRGEPYTVLPKFRPTIDAYCQVIPRFTVHAIETFAVHDGWQAAGTFDRLVSPRGWMTAPDGTRIGPEDRLVWDLKTAQSNQYFGPKFAVQLGVYAGGVPYCPQRGRLDWPGAPRMDWGLICHLPSGGATAQLYWVDLGFAACDGFTGSLGDVACLVRELRKAKLFHPAELPKAEHAGVGLNEVGFAAELRAVTSEEQLLALLKRLDGLLSEAQVEKARKRWRELRSADREPVA